MYSIILITLFTVNQIYTAGGTSCITEKCSCIDHITTRVTVTVINPHFNYRPELTVLYLQKVQMSDIESILTFLFKSEISYITRFDIF